MSSVVHVAAPEHVDEEGSSSCIDSLNSDDMYEIDFDKALYDGLKNNDPTITAFTVQFGPDCLANSIDWEEEGDVLINNNTHIKQLRIHVWQPDGFLMWQLIGLGLISNPPMEENLETKGKLADFCNVISRNRVMRNLTVQCDAYGVDVSLLSPFIESNNNLRELSLQGICCLSA